MQQLRETYRLLLSAIDPERLVFLDESGSNIAMTRDWARAPVGERATGAVPRNRGTVTTILGAIAMDGLRAMMTIEGGTTAEVFDAFVQHCLVPTLKPGDVVILDNVGAHKPQYIQDRIFDAGAFVVFLPPYSPDLNPIENYWSKLKGLLKSLGARTRAALDAAITKAIDLIPAADAQAWFRHCGYGSQPK